MKTIFVLACFFVVGCAVVSGQSINKPRAIYLVQGNGELAPQDLRTHPDVIVTSDVNKFKKYAQSKIALWIDKNAVNLVNDGWLDQAPQAYNPIVLIGYNDTLYSFRDNLDLCCFSGPIGNRDESKLVPGFSVILREESNSFPNAVFLRAYKQTPRVSEILDVTNGLLDGTIKPTPTKSFIRAATPSRPP